MSRKQKYSYLKIPPAPKKDRNEEVESYGAKIATYLELLGKNPLTKKYREFYEFCEVSGMSFNIGDSQRFKEGYLQKRSGGRFKEDSKCCSCRCGNICRTWSRRWFVLTNDFIAYLISSEYGNFQEVMLFDSSFQISSDPRDTEKANGILIKNYCRELLVVANSEIEQKMWIDAINRAFNSSEWSPNFDKRFNSFAPQRENNYCKWFVDGESYFSAVYDALISAKSEVYITDWWLSPKLYLKRPVAFNSSTQIGRAHV